MRSLLVCVVLLALSTCAFGSGWVGQGMVNRPNGDTADSDPTVIVDGAGCPWVVWDATPGDTTLWWTKWLGSAWASQRGVCHNAPGVWASPRPDLAVDRQGRSWLVWNNAYEGNSSVIAACHSDDSVWTSQQQVSPPASTDLYFAPKVSCGGGQVWCVWYGGPTDVSPYSIYASRWDSVQGWQPEMRVSPPNGNNNWWCDVAVDSEGTPHVVWTETEHLAIYCSSYDGAQWSAPLLVNDSSRVRAATWAAPRIAVGHVGVLRVSYTGVLIGSSRRDVFHTCNDGSGWTPSIRVTRDTVNNYDEWYSDIAAKTSDDVWVVFDRQGEGSDQFRVYAVHFDGQSWSVEQRLDNDSAYYDIGPVICLDSSASPWVLWSAKPYVGNASFDVFFNRCMNAGLAEVQHTSSARPACLRCAALQSGSTLDVSYDLAEAAQVNLALYDKAGRCKAVMADGYMPRGTHTACCPSPLAPGAYFCRLQAGDMSVISKIVLLGQ